MDHIVEGEFAEFKGYFSQGLAGCLGVATSDSQIALTANFGY
jgi:hypothetical protein